MKVRGTIQADLEITDFEAACIAIKVIRITRMWPGRYRIDENGNVCEEVVNVTSHEWSETKIIRPATDEDRFTCKLIQDILKG